MGFTLEYGNSGYPEKMRKNAVYDVLVSSEWQYSILNGTISCYGNVQTRTTLTL